MEQNITILTTMFTPIARDLKKVPIREVIKNIPDNNAFEYEILFTGLGLEFDILNFKSI